MDRVRLSWGVCTAANKRLAPPRPAAALENPPQPSLTLASRYVIFNDRCAIKVLLRRVANLETLCAIGTRASEGEEENR